MMRYKKYFSLVLLLLGSHLYAAQSEGPAAASKAPAAPAKLFDAERGAALRYNHPIVIANNQNRVVWLYNKSRVRGSAYNTSDPEAAIPEPPPST